MPKLPEYKGIKKGYPRIRRYFGRLAAYIQLLRPFTLFAAFLAGLFGTLAPVNSVTFEYLTKAIYVGATLALAQACGQCLNEYADADLDRTLPEKKGRPVPSGLISREEALGLSWLLALLAVGRAFTIGSFFGLTVLALLFFAVFYSLAPFSPRKVNPFLNVGWMAFSRGLLPMLAVWSVYGDPSRALKYSVFAFLWCLSLQGSKDVNDVEADKKFGIKTIPNTYGVKGFLVYATIISISMYLYAYLYTPFMLTLIPLSIIALLGLNRQVERMENNFGWISFYLGLGMIYLIILITEQL